MVALLPLVAFICVDLGSRREKIIFYFQMKWRDQRVDSGKTVQKGESKLSICQKRVSVIKEVGLLDTHSLT